MTTLENRALNAILNGSKTFNAIHKALTNRYPGLAQTATRMSLIELEKAGHIIKTGHNKFAHNPA